MGRLQQMAQVEFEVAGVGAESLLGGARAKASGLEFAQELLAQVGGEALEAARNGGFVDAQQAANLEEGVLVEIVGGKQEAVFGR